MSFTKKAINFGVLKLSNDRRGIQMFESLAQYITIKVGKFVKDFRLNGDDTVTVYLEDGEVRRYKSVCDYNIIK